MYDSKIQLGRWLTLSGYFLLMAGIYCWHLVINDTEKHLISIILLFQIGPLLFPLKGLLSGKLYTHAWSMYMAMYYFVVGVWYGANEQTLMIGIYITITSLMFFAGTAVYTRYMGKTLSMENSDTPPVE